MCTFKKNSTFGLISLFCFLLSRITPAYTADLNQDSPLSYKQLPSAFKGWTLDFTTYGWLPWLSGNLTVKGRTVDVNADPRDILQSLDWSTLPVWMSYAEIHKGPLSFFNDIVYSKVSDSKGFSKSAGPATLSGNIGVDYTQATIEFGAAYEIWSSGFPKSAGHTSFDVLAGGRYWYQNASLSANADLSGLGLLPESGGKFFARSGGVDWIDPFIGGRIRYDVTHGQSLLVRADFGGFNVGSDFTWQTLATYNWQMCSSPMYTIDGYLGYRALAVDYTQGSGSSKYEFDVLQQGPVLGLTARF